MKEGSEFGRHAEDKRFFYKNAVLFQIDVNDYFKMGAC